jgi:hypothetical protein
MQHSRLQLIEGELLALAIMVDGRNARNGYCTWTMIADRVERAWQLVRAELDGLPDDAPLPRPPSSRAADARADLETASDLAETLAARLRLVTSGGGVYDRRW